jgi:hypothetical protein
MGVKMSNINRLFGAVIFVIATAQSLGGQTLTERAQHSRGEPVRSVRFTDVQPARIEDLASGADLVVRTRVAKTKSYLTANESHVWTDYMLVEPQLISGSYPPMSSPTPGNATPLMLVVYGGEVAVKGVPVIVEDSNIPSNALKEGREYIIFLKRFGTEVGRYQSHNYGIFEIDRGSAIALAKQARDIFREEAEGPVADLLSKVQKASKK